MPPKSSDRPRFTDAEVAETLALQALTFLAAEPERLGRFLSLTGIGPQQLRASAGAPETLSAVLEHLLQDESLLMTFAAGARVEPEIVMAAHQVLGGRKSDP